MYKPGGSIRDGLSKLESKKWVLPAIQREFVWKPEQVCGFFDSLMRGFPFGTFLFWHIEASRSGDWKFYDFMRDYHERDHRHCPDLGPVSNRALTAVLDGQQRLTALNIGLRGSIAVKKKYARTTSADVYPRWFLFLNLLSVLRERDPPEGQIEGQKYEFRFMEEPRPYSAGKEFWFRASDILSMDRGPTMLRSLTDSGLEGDDLNVAFDAIDDLHRVIKAESLFYYEEPSENMERVLSIFIRLNSAGTLLSQSDLLHSKLFPNGPLWMRGRRFRRSSIS